MVAICAMFGLSVLAPLHLVLEPHTYCPVSGSLVHVDRGLGGADCAAHDAHSPAEQGSGGDQPEAPEVPHRHDPGDTCALAALLHAPALTAPELPMCTLIAWVACAPLTPSTRVAYRTIPLTLLAPSHSPPLV